MVSIGIVCGYGFCNRMALRDGGVVKLFLLIILLFVLITGAAFTAGYLMGNADKGNQIQNRYLDGLDEGYRQGQESAIEDYIKPRENGFPARNSNREGVWM